MSERAQEAVGQFDEHGVERDQSPTLAKLAEALAKAQGQIGNAKKDATNPHFKNDYATLASVREACREPLSVNGLAILQRVSTTPDGVCITTHLIHSSGEWLKDRCVFPVAARKAQDYGSAISYARRYTMMALLGIAADDDDDGNAANASPPQQTQQKTTPSTGKRTTELKNELAAKTSRAPNMSPWERIQEIGRRYGKSDAELGSIIKGATGKAKRSDLTSADVDMVESTLMALHPAPPAEEGQLL